MDGKVQNAQFASTRNVDFSDGAILLGLMSGTSLDGLDICAVNLKERDGKWTYEILAAATNPYPEFWRKLIENAFDANKIELDALDLRLGKYLAEEVLDFCRSHNLKPHLIASHGHTIHHQPHNRYTRQIGSGKMLARLTGIPTVFDFRSLDVKLGGQGAPLVPIVDSILFGNYAQCLNLGGFANVSWETNIGRVAFDITVANMLLNGLANSIDKPFDDRGELAKSGTVQKDLLSQLNSLDFYAKLPPKSLGREWFEQVIWPLFEVSEASISDQMATASRHIVEQLGLALKKGPSGDILVTGGGAYNTFLLAGLRQNLPSTHRLVLPKGQLINYKEAVAFAMLGALRWRGETNTLASVTGALKDSCGGEIALPE